MRQRFGSTIFCDDIREELGDKLSYMGVYRNTMIIPAAPPVQLPKICVASTFYIPIDEKIDRLTFRIMSSIQDESLLEVEVDLQPFKAMQASTEKAFDADDPRFGTWTVSTAIAPFVIKENMTLRARFDADGVEVKVGAIDILFEQGEQTPTPFG